MLIKYVYFSFIFSVISFATIGEDNRPQRVQDEVDTAFQRLLDSRDSYNGVNGWLFGGKGFFYYFMDFYEGKIIKELANRDNEKDIYLVDVVAGSGGWARAAERFIKEKLQHINKHFYIFSLTGSEELEDAGEFTSDNITHYRFNHFKIENIRSELLKKGLDLNGKVDLMVSSRTLRHLVDPFETLEDMYSLLNPRGGLLLSNGFLFSLLEPNGQLHTIKSGMKFHNTREYWNIFSYSNARYFFRTHKANRDID